MLVYQNRPPPALEQLGQWEFEGEDGHGEWSCPGCSVSLDDESHSGDTSLLASDRLVTNRNKWKH